MFEILVATAICAVALLWFSTKTNNIAFQKLFAGLGIILFAVLFLQASVIAGSDVYVNQSVTNYTYGNVTFYHENEAAMNQTMLLSEVTVNTITAKPGSDVVEGGNLALFTIFGFVFFLSLVWWAIDYMGIGMNDLGQIVRRKRPKGWRGNRR